MQINSNSGISQQYLTALQNKQATTSTNFEDSLTKEQEETTTVGTTSSVSKVEEQQERLHEVLTYANTKGMSYDDVDEYFSERTEEERSHIKFLITVSNNFSEDDTANEAIFMEANSKTTLRERQDFSAQLALESSDFSLGAPTLSDVLRVSDAWLAANKSGMTNLQEKGIFMNAADKARYENGSKYVSYNETKLSSEEASDFLSTMLNLAQQRMDEARGTAVYDDYKEAYERYNRMNDTYNDLVAKQEENSSVNMKV